jgi:molybdopterin biosynthesis enzyme
MMREQVAPVRLTLLRRFAKYGVMVAHSEKLQRIARLTPLGDVVASIDALVRPVALQQVDVASAFGLTLANDVVVDAARPAGAIAIRDGWAVAAGDILDASATAPVPLAQAPVWLETGDALPPSADTVAPFDAVALCGPIAEAVAPVVPGEGVLAAGGDVAVGAILRRAGARLRHSDLAVLAATGVAKVGARAPRIRLVTAVPRDSIIDAITTFIAAAIAADGGAVLRSSEAGADDLDRAFRDDNADAVIVIGGTGTGRRDASVRALARSGRVTVHGIAISPGETTALGEANDRPVLLLPGRIDSAMAVWLLLGRPLLARLAGHKESDDGREAVLSRKVSSSLGLTEVIPVRYAGEQVEPLASGYLSLAALANADGWILVPPDSEGYPAGTTATVRPLP